MDRPNGKIYEFGEFRLEPSENLLLKLGEPILLKPKAFQALVCLVGSAGKLVEKSELLEKVWENAFVEEASVSKCIWEIRTALDDDSKSSRFIQTVPKRGYRFVAELRSASPNQKPNKDRKFAGIGVIGFPETNVTPLLRRGSHPAAPIAVALPMPSFDPEPEPEKLIVSEKPQLAIVPPPKKSSLFRRNYWIARLAVAVVAASLFYHFYPGSNPPAASNGISSIAILPLKPVIPETRDENIEFAIADALILKISEAKNLHVTRLFSVRKFTSLETDPVAAGRDLSVDHVLSSSYQLSDGRIRVMSQLINVNTGKSEQTFRSESKTGDIFEVQDVVSAEIGNALFTTLGQPVENLPLKRGTDNEKAYELYLEGLYLVDKFTRDDSAKAVEILDRSNQIDPNFSAALAVKAQAYCQFAHLGGGNPTQIFSIAKPILDKALMLDHDNAVALTVRGTINRDYYGNSSDAFRDLQRAIGIDPNFFLAHRILAGAYYRDGKFLDAMKTQKRAVELNPTDVWDKWFLAEYQIASGYKEDGIENLRRLTEIDPSFHPSYRSLWRTYFENGEKAKAFLYFIKNKESWQESQTEIEHFKKIYKTSGWDGVLKGELAQMRSQDEDGKYSTKKIYIAELAAQLGQNDLAFHFLEQAATFRILGFSFIKVNPLLDPIRTDPRFDALLRKYAL